jgi:hypothetical protein
MIRRKDISGGFPFSAGLLHDAGWWFKIKTVENHLAAGARKGE